MADEEIVSGLKNVENQIARNREDVNEQTRTLNDSINKLRAESNRESSGLVDTLTTSLKDNAAEVASEFIVQARDHRWQEQKRIDQVDDEVIKSRDRAELSAIQTQSHLKQIDQGIQGIDPGPADEQQTGLLQRIAAFVNPDMMGSKDREKDLENKLRFETQLKWFKSMANSLTNLIPKPIRMASTGILTFLKGLAIGGALLALLDFLDSTTWKNWQKIIADKLGPMLDDLIAGFEKLPERLEKVKKAFGEGFFQGIDELGVQLGLWDKGIKKLSDNIENSGIAASIVGIGIGISLLGKAFTGIRSMLSKMGFGPATLPKTPGPGAGLLGKQELERGKLGGKDVVKSAIRQTPTGPKGGNWVIAGQGGVPTTELVPKEDIKKIKPIQAKLPAGGEGASQKDQSGRARGILRRIPWIGWFLSIRDLLNIVDNPDMDMDQKIAGVSGITTGLAGAALGGIAGSFGGALIGSGLFSWLTGPLGGLVGAWLGYNYASETGEAFAQYLLGQKVTAYDKVKNEWKGMFPSSETDKGTISKTGVGGGGSPRGLLERLGAGQQKTAAQNFGGNMGATVALPAVDITPMPNAGAVAQMNGAKLNRTSPGEGTAVASNVVNAPTTVQSNTHNEFPTHTSVANQNPLLNAVNATILT